MNHYITVDIDEKFPVYELVAHAEDDHPECAVLVTGKTYSELKRVQRDWNAAQKYLKEALEVQKMKWELLHDAPGEESPYEVNCNLMGHSFARWVNGKMQHSKRCFFCGEVKSEGH